VGAAGIAEGERLLSVREVAGRLGVCTATVYRLVERRELGHVRVSNAIRVTLEDLVAYVQARRGPTAAPARDARDRRSSPRR
jgi:excisionase family DNA binding protein